jgi:3-hydroxyisobutyrate dehydrogenase-like beta-hydroxyacid dehydrogenase
MFSIGVPENSVLRYETAVKNGKLLLVAHGSPAEVERAKDILDQTEANSTTVHGEALAAVGA